MEEYLKVTYGEGICQLINRNLAAMPSIKG